MSCENCKRDAYRIEDLETDLRDLREQLRVSRLSCASAAETATKALDKLIEYEPIVKAAASWFVVPLRYEPALRDAVRTYVDAEVERKRLQS